jgi:hypothetical protein
MAVLAIGCEHPATDIYAKNRLTQTGRGPFGPKTREVFLISGSVQAVSIRLPLPVIKPASIVAPARAAGNSSVWV